MTRGLREWMGRWWPCLCVLALGCQQDMASQPRYDPLEPSGFFADGRSARPLLADTVARGQLLDDSPIVTGKRPPAADTARAVALLSGASPLVATALLSPALDYDDRMPFAVSRPMLERGRQRYDIYCIVCHGPLGYGDGKIVERGFTRPPSFHPVAGQPDRDRSRGLGIPLGAAPVGYFFEVISKGHGAMPDYAAEVQPRDRWAIVAYVRALQLSQHFPAQDLTPEERRQLQE